MKTISLSIRTALTAGAFLTAFVSHAIAGCGDLVNIQAPTSMLRAGLSLRTLPAGAATAKQYSGSNNPSMVGMWNVQYISAGNSSHNPPIPDGAVVDFGYSQWHSDGTEILNSAGHNPASQNFCLGVWGQTGFLTYELNHFALSYNTLNQELSNYVNIREQVTLSPSGDKYTGPFTIDIYDTAGNHVDHIAGNVTGTRITVDTTPF